MIMTCLKNGLPWLGKKMSFFFFTYLIYTGNQRYKCTKNYYKNMPNKYRKLQKSNELTRKIQLIYMIALWEPKEEQ